MHRVHKLRTRYLIALCASLRVSASIPICALLNGVSVILFIMSYNSASFVVCVDLQTTSHICGAGYCSPLLFLGVALLQVMIALSGMRAIKISTWSSSPFDLTAALVHHTQMTPATLRCMRCVSDPDTDRGPAKPPETLPSAWHVHPSIRKVVISLWVIVAACTGWAALIMYIWDKYASTGSISPDALTTQTWSFIPNLQDMQSNYIVYGGLCANLETWILPFVNMAVILLGLHCSELIANVIRDERRWRYATGRKGLRVATNPLKPIFTHLICLVLFVAKPFLRQLFTPSIFVGVVKHYPRRSQTGLSFVISDLASDGVSSVFMFSTTGMKAEEASQCYKKGNVTVRPQNSTELYN
ncbi:hypothetical protein F4604DRAFT_1900153 [Suillus subluteus]|nr:hypothetical protein F4604DRAFT_1900153 [Suillus subluteus]